MNIFCLNILEIVFTKNKIEDVYFMIKRKTSIRFNINLKEKDLEIEIGKKLAENSLRFKWIKEQTKNLSKVLTPCAFCFYYKSENKSCDLCIINKHICDENGKSGLVGYIFSKYGNVFLKDIDDSDYSIVRNALNELKSKGLISKNLLIELERNKTS